MPARARTAWKISPADNQYVRQIGWTLSRTGKRTQAKFRLGPRLKEGHRRDLVIRQLWDQVERLAAGGPALWTPEALAAAKSTAATGRAIVQVAKHEGEDGWAYALRVAGLRDLYPGVEVQPLQPEWYAWGASAMKDNPMLKWINHCQTGVFALPDWAARVVEAPVAGGGPTLHDALRAYIRWLEAEYADPEHDVTPWGRTQIRQVGVLMDRHADLPLARLDFAAAEEMIRFWRKRPTSRANGASRPVAKKSAENFIKALTAFFKWLHRTDEFAWTRPENLDDVKTRVERVDSDRLSQLMVDDLFTIDELALLFQYATPLERTFLLLSLNCHFGQAEISSLLVGEVRLHTPLPKKHQETLGFTSTSADSFIRRLRRKSGVYGEWILFPQTVEAIEAALVRRRRQPEFGPEARLLLNAKGQPYDTPTKSGNANPQIANRFADLVRRIQRDGHPEFAKRPFKMVRKTAGPCGTRAPRTHSVEACVDTRAA